MKTYVIVMKKKKGSKCHVYKLFILFTSNEHEPQYTSDSRHFTAWLCLCCYCKEEEWLIRRTCMKPCPPVWSLEPGWTSPHLNRCPHTILSSHSKTVVSMHMRSCILLKYLAGVFWKKSNILCPCLNLQWFFPTLPVLPTRHGTPCLLLLPRTCWLDSEENPCLKNSSCRTRQPYWKFWILFYFFNGTENFWKIFTHLIVTTTVTKKYKLTIYMLKPKTKK